MNAFNTQKKSTRSCDDWHRADIVAALRKAGWSLRRLSREAGYSETTLSGVLERPWPKGEKIIAAAIGVPAEQIWPSRHKHRHFKPSFASLSL